MHQMGWIFYELNDPEELIANKVSETSVLLIDETILSQLQSSQDFIDSLNMICQKVGFASPLTMILQIMIKINFI